MQQNRIVAGVCWIVQVICVIALFAMMLYTVGNVLARVTAGTPLPAVIELITRWWMVPMVFGGWLLAQLNREHIVVDFVVERARGVVGLAYRFLNHVLLLLFLGIVGVGGWIGAQENRIRGEYGIDTGAPVWITRYAVPIMVAVLFGYIVYELSRVVRRRPLNQAVDAEGAELDGIG